MKNFFNNILNLFEGIETDNLSHCILSAALLKLMDCAVRYSKRDIVAKYNLLDELDEDLLFKNAVYLSGENLGFFNYSDWDLYKLSNVDEAIVAKKVIKYLNSFNKDVIGLFDKSTFMNFIGNLEHDDLYFFINDLNDIKVDENKFDSYKNLNESFNLFLSEYNQHFNINNYNSFVNSVLTNIFIGDDKNSRIFIDSCDDALVVPEVIAKHSGVDVSLCEENDDKYLVALSRMIIAGIKTSNISKDSGLNGDYYDLVICNKVHGDDVNGITQDYLKKLDNCSKLIFTIDSNLVNELIAAFGNLNSMNLLESIIYMPFYQNMGVSVIVLNKNKMGNLKNRFLLINESNFLKDNKKVVKWKFIISNLTKNILNAYSNHDKGTENSKIINYENPIKKLLENQLSQKYDFDFKDMEITPNLKGVKISKERTDFRNGGNTLNLNDLTSSPLLDINKFNLEINRPDISNFYDGDYEILELSQIANLDYFRENGDENYLVISTLSTCGKKSIDYEPEFDEMDYIKISITSDSILKEYLMVYLNSKIGSEEIEFYLKDTLKITPNDLCNVRVLVPSIDDQIDIIDAYNESEIFFKSIKELKNKLDNNIFDYEMVLSSINQFNSEIKFNGDGSEVEDMDKNWRNVYSRLIWPLAITYLSATRGGFEKTDKANKYLVLFEFIAAFNSIVLISGLPEDVYQEFKRRKIWNANSLKEYRDMTFGNWTFLSKNLSEIYNEQDFTTDFDKKLFNKISKRKINYLLNKTRIIRNKYFHGSMITPREAEIILEKLNKHLADVFDILSIYSDYKLFYVTGDMKSDGDNISYTVIHLNGPCKQPIYGNLKFKEMLDAKTLYLYNPSNKKLLKLRKELIKFMPIDELERRWGIYVFSGYNKYKNGKYIAKYKYFQENEKDYLEEIGSFENDIIR